MRSRRRSVSLSSSGVSKRRPAAAPVSGGPGCPAFQGRGRRLSGWVAAVAGALLVTGCFPESGGGGSAGSPADSATAPGDVAAIAPVEAEVECAGAGAAAADARVCFTVPRDGAEDVITEPLISVKFNADVESPTLSLAPSHAAGAPEAGAVTYDAERRLAQWQPPEALEPSETYTATVAYTAAGVEEDYAWSFTMEGDPVTYAVGGTLTGLAEGKTITLQLNGGDDLTLDHTANGNPYSFEAQLTEGSPYAVTVFSEPAQHHCTVINASGTVGDAAVVDVDVDCTGFPVIATGSGYTMAIKADGTLWGWGLNDDGRLGVGDTDSRTSPVQVGEADNWSSVSATWNFTLAVRGDGTLWAWGNNDHGRLGLGYEYEGPHDSPERVGDDTDWVSASTGGDHAVALKSDGTLWAWGANWSGQLGVGDTENRHSPERVGGDTDWVSVNAGYEHTVALKADGTLWAWGANGSGQLGMGPEVHWSGLEEPGQVGEADDWASVEATMGNHNLARKSDGTLWSWGFNAHGRLGLAEDDTANRDAPERVGTEADDWATVSGYYHSMAIKADGTLWAWGFNDSGRLGLGDYQQREIPVQVASAGDAWLSVSAGSSHTLAVKEDGTVWAWGSNVGGQLGLGSDGEADDYLNPVAVPEWSEPVPLL